MVLEVPSIPNISVSTDWAELSCLFNQKTFISKAELDEALKAFGYERQSSRIIDDIFGEVDWRNNIGEHIYPFYTDNNIIIRKSSWDSFILYSYQLLLSRNRFYNGTLLKKIEGAEHSKIFEKIVSTVVKKYVGYSINIGSPRQGRMDRSLIKSLNIFCNLTKESLRQKPEISHYSKDEGVDVIAWNPIDDRAGHITLLVQCTIEVDWHESANKIDVEVWKNIINFTCTPFKALAFPFVCHDQWKNHSSRGGILFDRLRITNLYSKINTFYLLKPLKKWVNTQKDKLEEFN